MKRLFLLPIITCAACGLVWLSACKEEKEEPLHFETTAPTAYTFPETETSATFSVSGNTAWAVEVTEGYERCTVTPVSGKGDATVTVRVTANPGYLQSSMTLLLTAGDYTKEIAITQAAPPCPGFSPGAIATAGQTVTIGGTPITINSAQAATGGDGNITYQWYKNGNAIIGATAASYTPPTSTASVTAVYTYTRRAKDNTCNTTLTPSEGSWVLTVVCFDAGVIAIDGQTVLIGGTPATINSVQNAISSGVISYQWYKNDIAITGATVANYTPPPADATVAGVNTYTRRAKDNVCNVTLTPSVGSWVLTVTPCIFNAGAIATDGQSICSGYAANVITSITDASGGDNNISYQWRRNGSTINGATAATYSPVAYNATVGAHTFTRWAHDGSCKTSWMQSAGSWVLIVTESTQFTLTTANSNQTIVNGAAITPIQYTTTNASTVTCSGLPDGITGAWASNTLTISGKSTASGTHSYVITATGITGCANAYASGSIKIYPAGIDEYACVSSNLTMGTVGFASTVTHVVSGAYGSQIWSAPVTATYCAKNTFNGGTTEAYLSDCRSASHDSYGHLFSWCMIKKYADSLCPDPWRAPTNADLCILLQTYGGRCNSGQESYETYMRLVNDWGAQLSGYALDDSLGNTGLTGNFSSTTPGSVNEYLPAGFYYINVNSTTHVAYHVLAAARHYGFTLRCVKDN